MDGVKTRRDDAGQNGGERKNRKARRNREIMKARGEAFVSHPKVYKRQLASSKTRAGC